ncbi:MAG: hypothetical protein B6230_06780, partial [Desulfobacteraceae bacterium 4572_89]
MVVAVNMIDEAHQQGISLDFKVLAQHLGLPVIGLSAKTGEGISDLKEALHRVIKHPEKMRVPHISCPPILEKAFIELSEAVNQSGIDTCLDHTFLAMRLLEEKDPQMLVGNEKLKAIIKKCSRQLEKILKTSIPVACANCRFSAARGLAMEVLHDKPVMEDRLTKQLDRIFLHPFLGLPLFFLLMLLLFQGVYGLG